MWFLPCVTIVVLLATSSTAVQPQSCPVGDWFQFEFVSILDVVVHPPALPSDLPPDTTFFTDVMLFTEEEIEEVTKQAMDFFNTRFGLEFSLSPPDGLGHCFFENATFAPYSLRPDLGFTATFRHWITNGIQHSTCFPHRNGGFLVKFTADQVLRGTYGGPNGILIHPGALVVWAFDNILTYHQHPLVIQFQTTTPVQCEPKDEFVFTILISTIRY